jgi:hypothetical protein
LVVDIINILGVTVAETKNHPPIWPNRMDSRGDEVYTRRKPKTGEGPLLGSMDEIYARLGRLTENPELNFLL